MIGLKKKLPLLAITYFLFFEFLFTSCAPSYRIRLRNDSEIQAILQQGCELEEKHGVTAYASSQDRLSSHIQYGIEFATAQTLDIKTGRIKALNLLEDFWEKLLKGPAFSQYLALEPHKDQVLLSHFKLTLYSRKPGMIPYEPPALSTIIFSEGVFSYYVRDIDSDVDRLILKESYSEAVALRKSTQTLESTKEQAS
ncbi:MAG: hypothetical protein JWO53_1020 [Chlamydiia bacterium]|nr:hypothetical protein [Chlamydiia bacterium]